MDKFTAKKLIKQTRDDYNKIADQFASTRKKQIWPDVLVSLNYLKIKKNKKVLDIGSGSGRLFPILTEFGLDYTGIDISQELIKNAQKDFPKGRFLTGEATDLPFADNSFDYIVSVAVLYHIPSKVLRKKAFKEIKRVAKPGAKIYISVWYFWNKSSEIRLIVKEAFKILFGRSELELGDFFRPWKTPDGKTVANRYCHAFTKIGLKHTLARTGFSNIDLIEADPKDRNINIICSK